jgi:hypothetical protein
MTSQTTNERIVTDAQLPTMCLIAMFFSELSVFGLCINTEGIDYRVYMGDVETIFLMQRTCLLGCSISKVADFSGLAA